MSSLELRVPPPAVGAVSALLMWLVAKVLPAAGFDLPGRRGLAIALAAGAVALGVSAALQFRKARTTIDPRQPAASSALVTGGVYRFSRNPMYLGTLLLLAAWALWLANVAALLLLPAFVVYLNRFQIEPEERVLAARFGAGFIDYCRAVRRWL